LLGQNGLHFVTGTPNAANGEVKATTISGHQASVVALLNNEVDAVFTFFDARADHSAYTPWKTANPTLTVIGETKVVALTNLIYNDTISALSSLSPGLKAAIQQAFIDVIALPDGLAALAIYNHKGYLIAHDSDYDSERALYQFLNPED